MQSLESSCQEADFIINDTISMLKGTSTNNNSSLRQTTQLPTVPQQQQLHSPYPSLQPPQQLTQTPSQQTHHSLLHHSPSNLSRLTNLSQIHHQLPPFIFDEAESPTDYSSLPASISDHDLLASVGVISDTHQQRSVFTDSLVPFNSIISPSPVVPDKIFSTSSTSPTLNCSKPEKQSLLSDSSQSSSLYNSSSPGKKAKLANTSLYGSPPLLQLFGPSSSIASCSSISTPTATSHLQQLQNNPNEINTTDVDLFKTIPPVEFVVPQAPVANITTITSTPQAVPCTPKLHSSTPTATGAGGTATSSGLSAVANTTFFDIHDKIRELYLYLLINDEKAFKESRRKHRTRSFVLERLVEREKLNTIVLNLHPGNKGYSLAFYQNDKHDDILNDPQGNNANSTNYEGTSGSSTQADRGGGPGGGGGGGGGCSSSLHLSMSSSGHKVGTNASSSRLKQTQISSSSLNSSNSNNLLISSNNLDVDDEFDGAEGDSATAAAVDSFGDVIDSLSAAVQASIDDNVLNTSSATVDSGDMDEDANLVEIMRWPYEADDLLNSIDKEELPVLFSDLLETRTPNVFYSGCVICQIRDFRQTFPISSNSCDIYHVLLKPTNDSLYSDINQLSIDSDISAEDKLMLESQLILATSEPLCLDPDPKIGRFAINNQHMRQIWNTPTLRRQMKKYSQISINRKRKIDQFTHNYGLELCDYLQRVRQRPRPSMISGGNTTPFVSGVNTTSIINSSNSSTGSTIVASFAAQKLPKKPADLIKPRPPNLDYPPLAIPDEVDVMKYAKAYKNPKMGLDCLPQLIEEYILQTDQEAGRVYHIKLSIFQRPSNSEYLGELYVDRDYKENERNGEACQFSLGTEFHANRYIEQFTEIFTEEDRKAVTITYKVPGKEPKVSYTTGKSERLKQEQQQQQQHQQAALAAALRQQQHQVQQHSTQTLIAAAPQQQRQIHIQPSLQPVPQIIAPSLNATNASALPGNQLSSILQGANIVGITTAGNVQQLRQQPQQIFEATGTVSVQGQPTQQLSLSNGSLVLVQQQAPGSAVQTGLTIQNANQQKAQLLTSAGQLAVTNAIRTQLGPSVPILQAQLKATPLVTGQQQQILQQKTQTNPAINALVTGLMNTANQFQQQQQQQQQVTVQQQATQKSSNNAAILSLLNSTPAPMTNTPVVSNTFNPPAGQQQQAIVHQQSTHQAITADTLIQQQPQQRKHEAMQNLLTNNLRKINMVSGGAGSGATLGLTTGGRAGTNLIAVSAVGLNPDNTSAQNVRVTMSALASQLASPPAVMTNSFAYTTTNNNNSISLNNNNNIKIVNNSAQRVITANTLRRDSTATVAAPSPGSDSNASNTSVTSNLGFTMSGHSALLATSPSPNSDQSQTPHGTPGGSGCGSIGNVSSTLGNQALLERLNSGTNLSTSPGLSPQQQSNAKSIVQHVTNVQSPSASISPLSSPPPQPSPQQPVQQTAQTTTLNLQGINLTSLQGAMATFPGLQNVQVQIPGLGQPISLSLSSAGLAAAVQQQQQTAVGGQQGNAQQTTSLLVSVPVTSTTQVNTMQTVPGAGNCGTVVSVPATTQTVVLTNAGTAGNSSSGVTGSMLSLPIAQFVTSGVKGLNAQTIRTATTGPSSSQNIVNANIIQTAGGGATLSNSGGNAIAGTVNVSNSAGNQPIQLLSTIQQRQRSIQLVGAKQIPNRGQLNPQRNTTSTIKIGAAPAQITANITASPLVITNQKLQVKLHKQAAAVAQQQQAQQQQQIQQMQQQGALQSQQQTQQQQHIQMSGAAAQQRLLTANAISVATPSQKRRRSATEINK